MDTLPPQVQLKISSYLSLNELVDCRLVSHSFKNWAEAGMRNITHLEVPNDNEKVEWDVAVEEMKESYVQHKFFSKPFVTVHVESLYNFSDRIWCLEVAGRDLQKKFCAFLGKFCPNLQVARLGYIHLYYQDLVLLGSQLQFFTCGDVRPGPRFGNSQRIVPSSFDQFPNLEGFIHSYVDGLIHDSSNLNQTNPIIHALLNSNRPVYIQKALNKKDVDLLAEGGAKFLHLLRNDIAPRPFSLPQSLAESLIELVVDFLPNVKFCPFTLPNLLYLAICCRGQEKWPAIRFLVSAPRLRYLTVKGGIKVQIQSYLMDFIRSFSQLRVLSMSLDVSHMP